MGKPKDDFTEALYEQIDARITEMNEPDYEYASPMTKKDWIFVWVIGIVCLAMVFIGYGLM